MSGGSLDTHTHLTHTHAQGPTRLSVGETKHDGHATRNALSRLTRGHCTASVRMVAGDYIHIAHARIVFLCGVGNGNEISERILRFARTAPAYSSGKLFFYISHLWL